MESLNGAAAPRLLLNTREVCDALRISRTTLHELVRDQRIEPIRIGRAVRFSVRALEQFVAEQARAGGQG